jgi:putative PIG3 family NAD(P)H quinone oxidoreductase
MAQCTDDDRSALVHGGRTGEHGKIDLMYAVTFRQPGGPEVLEWTEVDDPVAGPGEVVVDVVAAGVNRADLLQRAGFYDPPPGAPPYLGMECSGRISKLGPDDGSSGWRVGDEVCALLAGGGYAERVAVPVGQLLPVPAGVALVDAAALPEVACTVWSMLTRAGGMRSGQTLLVHGGGSGIGTFAIQYAKSLGLRVITTARAAKHAVLTRLGADVTIDYTTEDFVAVVADVTANHGVDLILDIQGGPYLSRNVDALSHDGKLVIIGLQGGRTGKLDLGALMAKRASIVAATLRARSAASKAQIVAGVRAEVWPLVEQGDVKPIVDRSLPMSRSVTAHEVVTASDHIGKVLLVTDSNGQP